MCSGDSELMPRVGRLPCLLLPGPPPSQPRAHTHGHRAAFPSSGSGLGCEFSFPKEAEPAWSAEGLNPHPLVASAVTLRLAGKRDSRA